ncbi:hypothetical protein N8148_03065 [Gammaproteobacteria bacterium]|nr:hypothetical protein [Gammaproteobacteria bacterium]
MADQIISRSAFCQKCADAKRPTHEDIVLLYGRSRQKFFFKYVTGKHTKKEQGIVPHIYMNKGFIKDTAIMEVHRFCGVVGCAVEMDEYPEGADEGTVGWSTNELYKTEMTYEEWQHLVAATDLGYNC